MRVVSIVFGIISLVLGVTFGWLFAFLPISIILGILAIIFGAITKKRGDGSIAGIICGSIGLFFSIAEPALVIISTTDLVDDFKDFFETMEFITVYK